MSIVLEYALFIITGIVVFGGLMLLGVIVGYIKAKEENERKNQL